MVDSVAPILLIIHRGEADDAVGLEQVVEPSLNPWTPNWIEGLPNAITELKTTIKALSADQVAGMLSPIQQALETEENNT